LLSCPPFTLFQARRIADGFIVEGDEDEESEDGDEDAEETSSQRRARRKKEKREKKKKRKRRRQSPLLLVSSPAAWSLRVAPRVVDAPPGAACEVEGGSAG
jgi:hypothetical protein